MVDVRGNATQLGKARSIGRLIRGTFAYYHHPTMGNVWCEPLNGQRQRQALVTQLLETLRFDALVETGTFRGSTTEFLTAHFGGPVYTVEHDPLWFAYSKARLRKHASIHVTWADSRTFLRRLGARPELAQRRLFLYLDAHWETDLPLGQEIETVLARWNDAVIMIDDFLVPDDAGYGYDEYGPDKILNLEYLERWCQVPCAAYFPLARSETETGARRGCVVLSRADQNIEQLSALPLLRRWTEGGWGR